MTTTAPHDITPPPGASVVDDWEPGPPPYRVILGEQRLVAAVGEVEVYTSVIQFADGGIDLVGQIELPHVHVQSDWDDGLTVSQARELIAALEEAVEELEGWTR